MRALYVKVRNRQNVESRLYTPRETWIVLRNRQSVTVVVK